MIDSQAYASEFGNRMPDADSLHAEEMSRLSRGLFEALVGFICLAGDGMGAARRTLRVSLPAGCQRLEKDIEAGADVQIVYDAESNYKADNEATIHAAGLVRQPSIASGPKPL